MLVASNAFGAMLAFSFQIYWCFHPCCLRPFTEFESRAPLWRLNRFCGSLCRNYRLTFAIKHRGLFGSTGSCFWIIFLMVDYHRWTFRACQNLRLTSIKLFHTRFGCQITFLLYRIALNDLVEYSKVFRLRFKILLLTKGCEI